MNVEVIGEVDVGWVLVRSERADIGDPEDVDRDGKRRKVGVCGLMYILLGYSSRVSVEVEEEALTWE
jgi:hypothetical protein